MGSNDLNGKHVLIESGGGVGDLIMVYTGFKKVKRIASAMHTDFSND